MQKPILISADWGTTSFRAFLLDRLGAIVDRREAAQGIMKVVDGDFSGTFSKIVGQWLNDYPNLPVLLSGMIGSEQGWSRVPHVPLPARLTDLAETLHIVSLPESKCAYIIPGLATLDSYGVHDIIRGEETQLAGILDDIPQGRAIICLPGTHSKWVTVVGGCYILFPNLSYR